RKNERKRFGGETPTDAKLLCRAIGHGRAWSAKRHLSAFHRGSGLGDRTPPPGFSSALSELVSLSGRYPRTGQPQCSDASRRPVIVPVGGYTRSRPGAGCKTARGRRTRPRRLDCLQTATESSGEVRRYTCNCDGDNSQ